jgi:hypothetical protein
MQLFAIASASVRSSFAAAGTSTSAAEHPARIKKRNKRIPIHTHARDESALSRPCDDVRVGIVIVWVCAMTAISASFACGGPRCDSFCGNNLGQSLILTTNGYLVSDFSSSCPEIKLTGSGFDLTISAPPLATSQTCHVEATVSDGEHFSLDVPFTSYEQQCCCGNCVEGYSAAWQAIAVNAPPSFPDASPFPPDANTDASDASQDASDTSTDALADAADE